MNWEEFLDLFEEGIEYNYLAIKNFGSDVSVGYVVVYVDEDDEELLNALVDKLGFERIKEDLYYTPIDNIGNLPSENDVKEDFFISYSNIYNKRDIKCHMGKIRSEINSAWKDVTNEMYELDTAVIKIISVNPPAKGNKFVSDEEVKKLKEYGLFQWRTKLVHYLTEAMNAFVVSESDFENFCLHMDNLGYHSIVDNSTAINFLKYCYGLVYQDIDSLSEDKTKGEIKKRIDKLSEGSKFIDVVTHFRNIAAHTDLVGRIESAGEKIKKLIRTPIPGNPFIYGVLQLIVLKEFYKYLDGVKKFIIQANELYSGEG